MAIDVLFINPSNQKKIYQDLSKEFTAIAPPVWTSLLANNVRKKGYLTAIYDVNIDGWDDNTANDIISKYNPSLIVTMVYGHQPSASTQTMPAAGRIASDIKKYNKDIRIAMGGTHPSALPERTLREEEIDYVIQGEGLYTIEGLIKYIKGTGSIGSVEGLWYKRNELIEHTRPASIINDLDKELDDYAWALLPDISNYRAHTMHCFQIFEKSQRDDFSDVRSRYVAMYTSLGCPYSCSYCCINAVFQKVGIRYWSLEKVLSWIDTIVNKYGVKNIRFDDELFILSPKRVETFCDMIIERGYDLNIWVYGRVDTIKDSLLNKMKKAGINWICLGIECGNEKVRRNMNKIIGKNITEVVKSIQSHNIYVLGNYMFGLPDDDINTMEETLQLSMDLNCEFVNYYTVMAYPGSSLYNLASGKKGYLPDSWEGFSQHSFETQPLPTKYLSPSEVLRFRDNAFYRYYTNEKYLNMVKTKFGKKVESHIERMLNIKVERKILQTGCLINS